MSSDDTSPHPTAASATVQSVLTGESRDAALARLGRALADPTRCRILLALLDGPTFPGVLA